MKKILAKKKVHPVRTAVYRKKTHFSKKEQFLLRHQSTKKTLRLKRISWRCYGNLRGPNHGSVEKLPKSWHFSKENRFFPKKYGFLIEYRNHPKEVWSRVFWRGKASTIRQNEKMLESQLCWFRRKALHSHSVSKLLSSRKLNGLNKVFPIKGERKSISTRINHRPNVRRNRLIRWKLKYTSAKLSNYRALEDMGISAPTGRFINRAKYQKRLLGVKKVYVRKRAYNLAFPRIIYRRRRKKLKKPVFYRKKGFLPYLRLKQQNHRFLYSYKRKWKRYFNYYWQFRIRWRRLRRFMRLNVTYQMRKRKFRYYLFEKWHNLRIHKRWEGRSETLRPNVVVYHCNATQTKEWRFASLLNLLQPQSMSLSKFNWQKQKLYLSKSEVSISGGANRKSPLAKSATRLLTSPSEQNFGSEQRTFSTFTRLVPKRLVRVKRKFLRAMKKIRSKRKNVWLRVSTRSQKPWTRKKPYKLLFTPLRLFKKKRLRRGMQRKTKRRYGFKRWKFRFPKWRLRPRRYWNTSKSSIVSDWQFIDISSYRLYRRPHQPYRRRKPWATKKYKGLRLIYQKTRPGYLLEPKDRLVLQQRYSQVYTKFYGSAKLHQIKERAMHFRRLTGARWSKIAEALNWYELRLDVSLCRLKLAPTIKIARLLISQGYVRVNGIQTLTPEKRLDVWDVVQITLQSTYFFGKYWYSRNRYQRYLFKQRFTNFTNNFQHKAVLPYGFFTRLPRLSDLPRRDKITWEEFGRLLLI